MTGFFKKVGIVLMAITMLTLSACNGVNQATARDVETALEEKYGISFKATHIGDRWNKDTAKLYVHPEQNPEVVFTAVIDQNGKVTDDFIRRSAECSLRESITDSFAHHGMTAFASITLTAADDSEETDIGLTRQEYAQKYDVSNVFLYLILKDQAVDEKVILETLTAVNQEFGCRVAVYGYLFHTAEYEACEQLMRERPGAGSTMIEKQSPCGAFVLTVKEGVSSLTESELAEKIRGEG